MIRFSKVVFRVGICSFFFVGMSASYAQGAQGERRQGPPPSIDEIFERMDANSDELLSKDEVKGPLKNDFDKIDLNEDGYLSREELEKAPKPEGNRQPPRERN